MTAFEDAVYRAVNRIPKGKVACYGQIALAVGKPNAARAVGNALHRNPFPGVVPCHRVVTSAGYPSTAFAFGGSGKQAEMLQSEGIPLCGGKVPREYFVCKL